MSKTVDEKLKELSYLIQLTTYAVTMKNDKLQTKLTNKITQIAESEVEGVSDLKLV